MGRFSLSPPSSVSEHRSSTSSRGLPCRDQDFESSDDDSLSSTSYSSDSDEEEPHPLGFGVTRFSLSPPPKEPISFNRFVFEDSDDEMEMLARPPELRKEDSQQSFPLISSYISPYTAPTKSLLCYSSSRHDDGDRERMDKLASLLEASTVADRDGESVWLNSKTDEHQDVGKRMWLLANAANHELGEIQKQAQLERARAKEVQQNSASTLRNLLERDEADARQVILREQKEKEAREEAEKKRREQIAKEAAAEKERNEKKEKEKKAKEEKAKETEEAARAAARAKEKKKQEAEAQKTEYVARANRLVAKLADVRKSVEPFEKLKVPQVSKRRLNMKKTVRGKLNTLSHDAGKVKAIAADVSAQISEARAQDEQIKQQILSGASEFTSDMSRGKRYFVDLLSSNVIVRVQAESFRGLQGDGFPLAAMLAAVSIEAKELAPMLAAHIYAVCPMAIPTLPRPSANSSEEELMASLGMTENETFEKFLGRTENTISMVAEIMASRPSNHMLLGGHKGALDWLERFLNLLPPPPDSPLPLLTAPVLDAFLTGAGNMLANKYPEEFKRHLDVIMSDTVNRLDVGTIGQPSAIRLKKLVSGGFDSFACSLPPGAVPELYDSSSTSTTESTFSSSTAATSNAVAQSSTVSSTSPFTSNQTGSSSFGTGSSSVPSTAPNSIPFGGTATPAAAATDPFGSTNRKGALSESFGQDMSTESNPPIAASSPFGASSQNAVQPAFSQANSNNTMNSTPFGSASNATTFGSKQMSGTGTTPFGGVALSNTNGSIGGSGGGGVIQASPFGGGNMQTTSGTATSSPFGTMNNNASPFGGTNTANAFATGGGNSVFGTSNTVTNSTPFGGPGSSQNSTFGGTAGQGFGTASTTMQSSPFGGTATQSQPFGTSAQSNPFGGNAQSTPNFGGGGTTASTHFGSGSKNSQPFGGNNSFGRGKTNTRPCKFFAEGRCRNGANCRFSHETGGGNNPFGGGSSGGNTPFSAPNPFGGPRR